MPATEAPPAPPPAATPAAPSAPPPEKAPQDFLAAEMADFAEMDKATVPPAPSSRRDERGKFTKPADKPAAEVKPPGETKPPEGETKPPEGGTNPTGDEPPKPVRAAELRTAYEGLKKKVNEELQPTIQKLQAKIKQFETKAPEDTAPVLEKIKTLEARNAELEKTMALVDYEQSNDYQTKYEKPYADMWGKAAAAFNQLTVKEPTGTNPDTGEPTFSVRRATEADLIKLGALPLSELDEAAQAMFGPSAPRAVQYIERLRDLAEAKQTAIIEAKQKAGEWKSQRSLESSNALKNRVAAWAGINKSLQEKFPKAFVPESGDADDAAAHTKGFALADLMFLGASELKPEQIEALPESFRDAVKANQPLTEAQKVQLHALARLKMANHDRKVAALKKANARIAELENTLADYEESEPSAKTAGGGPRTITKSWDEQVADELRQMDK